MRKPDAQQLEERANLLERFWAADGPLARTLPGFEQRPQQAAMARAVAEALDRGDTLLVEAGTGTGKTLAYLVPAVLSGKKVVISTGTKALQDQLATHDLPMIETALGRPLSWCVMKGRENYLCLERHDRTAADLDGGRREALDRIARWRETSDTGDRAELAWLAEDDAVWKTLSVTAEQCLGATCPRFEPCFLTRLKHRAAAADVVIVNHALFFADLSLGPRAAGGIVPHHTAIVFDEAHGLEDVATNHWGVAVSRHRVLDLLADLAREPLPPSDAVVAETASWRRLLETLRHTTEREFDALRVRAGVGIAGRIRWSPDRDRETAGTSDVGEPAMLEPLAAIGGKIRAWAGLTEGWARLAERAASLAADLRFIWRAEEPSYVYWVEPFGRQAAPDAGAGRAPDVRLAASPVDVSRLLRDALFSRETPCVLTSATLATGGDYGYIKSRLGIDCAHELLLDSPFDYSRQALLYVPTHLPEPRDRAFADAAADEIVRIVTVTGGRAFLLFTSRLMLERVHRLCRCRLPYPVFKQGEAPRFSLIERFKLETPAVLFATMGFWQGIDVGGEALSCVILDKLPFAPPDDPLIEARLTALRERGVDPFATYQLPAAAMWLKQGMGRLIRTARDRGVVCVLDTRLTTRGYGAFFLQSLPPCPVTTRFADLEAFFAEE